MNHWNLRLKVTSATALLLLAAVAVTGCTASGAATPTPSATATNPYGGFKVDNPKDTDVVLTVVGTKSVDYTMGQLKAMADQNISVMEPFVKKQQSFAGVLMRKLFDTAGYAPTVKVSTIALNEYVFTDTVANLEAADAILAVSRDGQPIPMDEGGPIRMVFAKTSKYFSYLDAWNWSLRTIKVSTK